DQVATSTTQINSRSLLQRLEIEYPSTWLFLVDGLVGATPELLVRLSKSLVTSRVLAGTIRKTGNEDRDLALAASLAKSSKDLEEHEYAVRSVADALEPFCSSTNVPESPFVLHLSNVMHLATDVTGVLNDSAKQADVFTLV
ncbi:MAG: chorismate-binding protein, partial [bacterium]